MLKEADLGNAFTVIEVFVSGKIKVRLFSSFLIPRRGLKVVILLFATFIQRGLFRSI